MLSGAVAQAEEVAAAASARARLDDEDLADVRATALRALALVDLLRAGDPAASHVAALHRTGLSIARTAARMAARAQRGGA